MAHFELIEKVAPNAVIKVVGVGGGGGTRQRPSAIFANALA